MRELRKKQGSAGANRGSDVRMKERAIGGVVCGSRGIAGRRGVCPLFVCVVCPLSVCGVSVVRVSGVLSVVRVSSVCVVSVVRVFTGNLPLAF